MVGFAFQIKLDEDSNRKPPNSSEAIQRFPNLLQYNDPAILNYGLAPRFGASQETVVSSQDASLSKKECSNPSNLSTSEPDVRSILRYSRERLLILRNSDLSKRKPEQLGRAWVRIGVSIEGNEYINIYSLP